MIKLRILSGTRLRVRHDARCGLIRIELLLTLGPDATKVPLRAFDAFVGA